MESLDNFLLRWFNININVKSEIEIWVIKYILDMDYANQVHII